MRECVQRFAQTRAGVVIFVDQGGRFFGLLTAGDVFRLLARGVELDSAVRAHINTKPITVTSEFTGSEILRLMTARGVSHVPVLRADGTVERLATQAALLAENLLRNRAVIMAGGEGLRLRPLTNDVPKALVKIDGKPLLAILLERLRGVGILDITICIRYRGDKIRAEFGDGSAWHVNISYVEEEEPLGTCGGLSLIRDEWTEPFFVLNCDVLTDVDLVNMYKFHAFNRSDLTVAVKDQDFQVPFGIVEVDHERVVRLSEKPKLKFYVNAGLYLLNPETKKTIPFGRRYDMTDLIADLLANGSNVCSFPIRTAWLDVGDIGNLRLARRRGLDRQGEDR
ncbi:MAG: nucleotidyltransferase family protein [Candidatus Rokubacteria bacterium]|nr:nucleotidyltransferase family protein [Candidatus Rokubacteria bacterium]